MKGEGENWGEPDMLPIPPLGEKENPLIGLIPGGARVKENKI